MRFWDYVFRIKFKIRTFREFSWQLFLLVSFGTITACQKSSPTLFESLPPAQTGISFENTITETDTLNMLRFANFYTGAGVAVGDFNNDGLDEIFFGGNMVSSRLYLNKGSLKFEDITEMAGIDTRKWITGISIVDINQDGWQDIYLSISGLPGPDSRRNQLFINNHDLTFTEQAKSYGIDDAGPTTHSVFFDYDKDGDLDIFLAQNGIQNSSKVNYLLYVRPEPGGPSTDKLYRNNGDNTYTDVSTNAGIIFGGYSLGVVVSDTNNDNWDDIFVSNDFQGNDLLYINNGDGTFSEQAKDYFRHTSFSGMGADFADINQDGHPDLLVLDMLSEENSRQKTLMEWPSYEKYIMSLSLGYLPQYTRNTLQVSNGKNFSEIGQLAGIESTDWSWAPVFADFDNDRDLDLLVTNGFVRSLGDLDFINYRSTELSFNTVTDGEEATLKRITEQKGVPLVNYVYEYNGNLGFAKKSKEWGIVKPTFSYGASLSDLDNDGDIELIINNSNDKAQIYRNNLQDLEEAHSLKIKLQGMVPNLDGIGTKIWLYTGHEMQFYQHFPYRGYLGTTSGKIHFGLGNLTRIDSVKIKWPSGITETIIDVTANQEIEIYQENADTENLAKTHHRNWLQPVDSFSSLNFRHQENIYVDFKIQPLIPHMHSQNGPGIAIGDLNGDGTDDVFIGGAAGQSGQCFIQLRNGQFQNLDAPMDPVFEDLGSLIFDADMDGDQDLLVVSGGTSWVTGADEYGDRLYLNDGQGRLKLSDSFHFGGASSSTVVGADYDKDGDMDLFIGGRVSPGRYPEAPVSQLLVNQSREGNPGTFMNITEKIAGLSHVGMVTGALWSDYNNDSWLDLVMVGEWMTLVIFKNDHGNLKRIENIPGNENHFGWWNSLIGDDFDKDGDTDYVAGNLGFNSHFQCSIEEPLTIYAKDFDNNGKIDPVLSMYIEGVPHVPYFRGQLFAQLQSMKRRFNSYYEFSQANFHDLFSKKELEDALVLRSQTFASSYIENIGDGQFVFHDLPIQAQIAPGYGLISKDLNEDGNQDIMIVGNSFANDAFIGRYDAGFGICLLGDGTGNFTYVGPDISGFRADHDAKALASILIKQEEQLIITNNDGLVERYKFNQRWDAKFLKILPNDAYALIHLKNGQVYKKEFYHGSGYLTQSSRYIGIDQNANVIELFQFDDTKRAISLP